jgi:hypothetical protein
MTHGRPPYSCTRLRTFHGAGSTSTGVPSDPSRISAERPPSAGRPSAHQTTPSCTSTHLGATPAAATDSAVTGDSQLPNSAIFTTPRP